MPTIPQPFPTDLAAVRARQRHEHRAAKTFWVIAAVAILGAVAVAVVATRSTTGTGTASPETTVAPTAAPAATTAAPTAATTASVPPPTPVEIGGVLMIGAPVPARPLMPDPEDQTFEFIIRRYDNVDVGSPAIEHQYLYDAVNDNARVFTSSTSEPNITVTLFGPTYRTVSYPDGTLERMPRTAASLSPEPDIWMARRLGQDDIVPEISRPFTNVVSVEQREIDGEPATVIGVHLDVAAFAAQHPAEHADWLWRWASQSPFDPTLVDVSRRQLALDPPVRSLEPVPPVPLEPAEIEMQVNVAAVIYALDEEGSLLTGIVIDPVNGFRAIYSSLQASDAPTLIKESENYTWVDAPA